jgi:hypothetical protein
MTLIDCRHRVCFDCISKRITNSDAVSEFARCPLPRCANLLTKSEVARVSEKVNSAKAACARIMSHLPDGMEEEKPAVSSFLIFMRIFSDQRRSDCVLHDLWPR